MNDTSGMNELGGGVAANLGDDGNGYGTSNVGSGFGQGEGFSRGSTDTPLAPGRVMISGMETTADAAVAGGLMTRAEADEALRHGGYHPSFSKR